MPDDLPRPVRTLVDAANRGDTDAFLAGFTPDGLVDDWGRECRVQVALTIDEVELGGPHTIVSATVGGNGFNGPSTFTFVTVGGLVSRMTIRA